VSTGERHTARATVDPIPTPRLELVLATREVLAADLAGPRALADALGVKVPVPGWPTEHWDHGALNWSIARIDAEGPSRWGAWYWIRREDRLLVGAGGFKGGPDASGTVEIGYGVVEQLHRQGIATEACTAMVAAAFSDPAVQRVVAETYPHLAASLGVMRRLGMSLMDDPSEPGVVRYGVRRQA
jgi:[ribosomal protein S5]-alanine N-acetyltransferase